MDSLGNGYVGKYAMQANEHKALNYRTALKSMGNKKYTDSFKNTSTQWTIDSLIIQNENATYEPFKTSFNFLQKMGSEKLDKLYFNPLLSDIVAENPFKAKYRYFPLDLTYPYETIIMTTLKIPTGFMVETAPKPIALTLPNKGGKFTYVIETDNNEVKVKSHLLVAKARYTPTDYYNLRMFFDEVIKKQAEQIVLIKKH